MKQKEKKPLEQRNKEFERVKTMQKLSLEMKVDITLDLIEEWYDAWEGDVSVSFSGGLDSTVLLHLVRSLHPEVPAYFVDTGLEYPEIKKFVKSFDNVHIVRPKMTFRQVLDKYGVPVISKRVAQYIKEIHRARTPETLKNARNLRLRGLRKTGEYSPWAKIPNKHQYLVDAPFKISDECCKILKKDPLKKLAHTFVGMRVEESQQRMSSHLHHSDRGHYWSLTTKAPYSAPLFFWRHLDIWDYIEQEGLEVCEVYLGENAVQSTGCMFCLFGVHLEGRLGGRNRFQLMKETHPKQYDYCINKLGLKEVLEYIGVPYE